MIENGNIVLDGVNCVFMLSDIHYGFKSDRRNEEKYIEWMENMNGYFHNFFIPAVEKYKTIGYKPILIIAGDFFDVKKFILAEVMNSALDLISELRDILPIYFIVGNHETSYTDNNRANHLRIFDNMDNVHVIKDTCKLKICGNTFELISWIENSVEQTKLIKASTADYLILHADINGLIYPSKIKIADKVETKGFKGTHIYSGHIHKRQEKGKVTYLGSPYEMEWSDSGNIKGIYVLKFSTFDDGHYEASEDFIENTYSPRFIKCNAEELKGLQEKGKDISEILRGNYITVDYNSADAPKYAEFLNSLNDVGTKGLEFNSISEEVKIDEETSEVIKSLTIDDAVYECIDSMDLKDDEKEFLKEKHKAYTETL